MKIKPIIQKIKCHFNRHDYESLGLDEHGIATVRCRACGHIIQWDFWDNVAKIIVDYMSGGPL